MRAITQFEIHVLGVSDMTRISLILTAVRDILLISLLISTRQTHVKCKFFKTNACINLHNLC